MCSVDEENFFKLKHLFSYKDMNFNEDSTGSQGDILITHGSQQVGNYYKHYLAISCHELKIQQYQWHAQNFSKQSTSISFLNENSYVVAMTYIPLSISPNGEDNTERLYLLLAFESGRISIYDWKTLYYTGFLPYFDMKKDLCISSFTIDKSLSLIRESHNSQSDNKTGSLLIHYSTKKNTKHHPSVSNVGSKNVVVGVSLKDFQNYLKKTQMLSMYPISFYIYILPNDVVDYAVIPSFECYTFNYITSISCENSQCVLPELNTLYVPATQKNSINSVKYHEETVNDTYLEGDSVQKYWTRKNECEELLNLEKKKKNYFLFSLRESLTYGLKNFFDKNYSLVFCILSNETFLYQMTTKPPQNEEIGSQQEKRNLPDKNLSSAKSTENSITKKSPHVLKGVTLGLKATSSFFSFVKPFSSRLFGHIDKNSLVSSDCNDLHEDIPLDNVSPNHETTEVYTLPTFSQPEYTEDLTISSYIHLKPVFLYPFKTRLDQDRKGLRLFRCPYNNHLALATDNFGRVLFLHLPSMQLVYMWKGYRFAQVAWIRRNNKLYIVLYVPLQGILELWAFETIQRINVIKVSMHGILVSNQNHTNQDETVPFVFVNNEGSIFVLSNHL